MDQLTSSQCNKYKIKCRSRKAKARSEGKQRRKYSRLPRIVVNIFPYEFLMYKMLKQTDCLYDYMTTYILITVGAPSTCPSPQFAELPLFSQFSSSLNYLAIVKKAKEVTLISKVSYCFGLVNHFPLYSDNNSSMVATIFVHWHKLQTYMVENKRYQEQFGNVSGTSSQHEDYQYNVICID